MKLTDKAAVLEAVLFACGESVSQRLRASKRAQYPSLRTLSTRRMQKTAAHLLCCGFRDCISWLCGGNITSM